MGVRLVPGAPDRGCTDLPAMLSWLRKAYLLWTTQEQQKVEKSTIKGLRSDKKKVRALRATGVRGFFYKQGCDVVSQFPPC